MPPISLKGFPGGISACQCRRHKRHRFNLWVSKIPWKRAWQPSLVFLPGESPWTEEPGGLQSTGSQRVRHDWNDLACISLKFFMISRSRKFTMQKDLKSHSSWTAGSYLQHNCIQNFSDKQQLSPNSHPMYLIHATTFTNSQSHAAVTRLSPRKPTDGPSLWRAHSSMSFLAPLLHSAISICPSIDSVKWNPQR